MPAYGSPAASRHPAVLADDRDLLEPVLAADLEVVGVVARRDLERPCPELGIDVLVLDHRQAAADQGQDDLGTDERGVALVAGGHRDRRVGEHRLGPDCRDRDRARAVGERVIDRVQGVGERLLLDLEVRDGRAEAWIPVHHVVVAVDVAARMELDEDAGHGARVCVVHREALVRVVR